MAIGFHLNSAGSINGPEAIYQLRADFNEFWFKLLFLLG